MVTLVGATKSYTSSMKINDTVNPLRNPYKQGKAIDVFFSTDGGVDSSTAFITNANLSGNKTAMWLKQADCFDAGTTRPQGLALVPNGPETIIACDQNLTTLGDFSYLGTALRYNGLDVKRRVSGAVTFFGAPESMGNAIADYGIYARTVADRLDSGGLDIRVAKVRIDNTVTGPDSALPDIYQDKAYSLDDFIKFRSQQKTVF